VLILTAKEISSAERSRLTHNNIQQLIQKGSTDRQQLVASVRRMLSGNKTDAVKQTPTKAVAHTVRTGACTILLVEDNADNRLTVSAILEDNGCELFIAEDGEQGVRAARDKQPDLILMDIQLPVMNGMEAIKLIRSDPATRHIPIIAVSARAMKGEKESILAAGADDYIPKPINPDELLSKVKKWMS
jgi:two-component system cell cycle response regulator DivK